ncbi:semaphorin-7A-like [Sebastes fasciatus]|uniref:semaphorin-7A-like n=1 Tax=Sebastes fasciatus TaxID=394691 RepID=UPI003D9DEFAE
MSEGILRRMGLLFLTVYLSFSCLNSLTEANSTLLPRMTFTEKETAVKRLPLPGHQAPVGIVLEGAPDTVIVAGQKHLNSFNFQNPQKAPVEISVSWTECIVSGPPISVKADCNYNIRVVHKMEEDNQVFLCGTNGKATVCCAMDVSVQSPSCIPYEKMKQIKESIKEFGIKEGEPSALVESEDSDLYITYSGSQEFVGIHKFGRNRVVPARHDKEQHYVGLVLGRQKGDHKQNKAYAFYKEKNRDTGMYSEMWLPFVTRVCMEDRGGPKNTLQSSWTSHMTARLFCGDSDSKQHFSELVDVATVPADQWQDTRVYALFRNEWGMSAVCVYMLRDIEQIFATSPFKGKGQQERRPRACVRDSTRISLDVLKMIEENSEMEHWVRPVNKSGPLLFNHHSYTHIYVDGSQKNNHHTTVLFLSLTNGRVHKAMQDKSQSFVIAEYQPFDHRAHILSITFHPTSRKLYVNSRSELVQLDVADCAHYGDRCEDCVLARDPYCGWNGTHCTPDTNGTLQDLTQGNHTICVTQLKVHQLPGKAFRSSTATHADEAGSSIALRPESKYFLQCLVSSHHAQYTWLHLESNTSCSSREQQCLLLINSMCPEQVGIYTCVSEEMGYSRVLAQYQLRLESRAAGRSSSPLVWLCLMAVLIKSLSC